MVGPAPWSHVVSCVGLSGSIFLRTCFLTNGFLTNVFLRTCSCERVPTNARWPRALWRTARRGVGRSAKATGHSAFLYTINVLLCHHWRQSRRWWHSDCSVYTINVLLCHHRRQSRRWWHSEGSVYTINDLSRLPAYGPKPPTSVRQWFPRQVPTSPTATSNLPRPRLPTAPTRAISKQHVASTLQTTETHPG